MEQFAVVVPSAGGVGSLRRTVRSLERAAEAAGWTDLRLIVVDDADEPRVGLSELGGAAVVDVVRGGRLGAGPARNLGAGEVQATWLVFVDDDVEVDDAAFQALMEVVHPGGGSGIVGGAQAPADVIFGSTRAPADAPRWLHDAYVHGLLGSSLGGVGARDLGVQLVSTLLAIRHDVFDRVGGYPERAEWGATDVLLGLRLQADGSSFAQVPEFSGVHHYVPSWQGWLRRRAKAGERFAALHAELSPSEASGLLAAIRLDGRMRSLPKRLASYVPDPILRQARTRWLRRLAAAGVEAKSFRRARDERA